ncbi:MAG: flagellar biosynthetic protein FliO [Pseudomonadota bacterium]
MKPVLLFPLLCCLTLSAGLAGAAPAASSAVTAPPAAAATGAAATPAAATPATSTEAAATGAASTVAASTGAASTAAASTPAAAGVASSAAADNLGLAPPGVVAPGVVELAPDAPATKAVSPTAPSGGVMQTMFALLFVLVLLVGLAWFMKRYGPKINLSSSAIRLVGSLNLGGRERIVVIEVGDQWIVLGASPGRINSLATMPRQEAENSVLLNQNNGPAAANFSEWLKQTLEKRNGK